MLDDYFHGSSPEIKKSNRGSSKGSHNNSKQISISKAKNRSVLQNELNQDINECEREFLERPK